MEHKSFVSREIYFFKKSLFPQAIIARVARVENVWDILADFHIFSPIIMLIIPHNHFFPYPPPLKNIYIFEKYIYLHICNEFAEYYKLNKLPSLSQKEGQLGKWLLGAIRVLHSVGPLLIYIPIRCNRVCNMYIKNKCSVVFVLLLEDNRNLKPERKVRLGDLLILGCLV